MAGGFKHAPTNISSEVGIPLMVCLAVLAIGCLAESARYLKNQVRELVASIAAERSISTLPGREIAPT